MGIRLGHQTSRLWARLRRLSSTIGRKVLDNTGEGGDRLGRDGEGPGLRCVRVIVENGRNIEVVPDLVGTNDGPNTSLTNINLPKSSRGSHGVAARTTATGTSRASSG